MLVNKEPVSRWGIYGEQSYVAISWAKLKESLEVNSLRVRGSSIGIKT